MTAPKGTPKVPKQVKNRTATRRHVARPKSKAWSGSDHIGRQEPKLLHVLEERTDPNTGELIEITRADKIVAYLRTNVTITDAAAAVGVDRNILHVWLRAGAEAQAKVVARRNGQGEKIRLTNFEKVCLDFKTRAEEAMAEGHIRAAGALTRMAEGGTEEVVVTEKVDRAGRVIEHSERRSTLTPNVAALNTLLSRRWPDVWGVPDQTAVTTGGGGVTVSVGELAEVIDGLHDKITRRSAALAAITAGVDAEPEPDVIDAVIVDDPEPPPD